MEINENMDNEAKAEKICSDLNKLRSLLTQTKNISVHIAANWDKLNDMGVNINESIMKLANNGSDNEIDTSIDT